MFVTVGNVNASNILSQKTSIRLRVEKNPGFKKNNPHGFFGLKKTTLFLFILKRNKILFFFLKKTEKPHFELFLFHHAISLFSELRNNNLLYLLWHSKLRVKKCTTSLISQCVVGQFTPKWSGLASMCTANRDKHPHTNSAVSHQVYVHALLVQYL